MTFADSRLFILNSRLFAVDSRLFTLDSRLLLSTFTLDSRPILSTLDPRLLDTLFYIPFPEQINAKQKLFFTDSNSGVTKSSHHCVYILYAEIEKNNFVIRQ